MVSNGSVQPSKKRRGGQPGNTNALKHGFYSRSFSELEAADLDSALNQGLTDEIAMLRVIIRRVFDQVDGEIELPAWIDALSALGVASTRLAGLLKTERILNGQNSDVATALSQALSEMCKEMQR